MFVNPCAVFLSLPLEPFVRRSTAEVAFNRCHSFSIFWNFSFFLKQNQKKGSADRRTATQNIAVRTWNKNIAFFMNNYKKNHIVSGVVVARWLKHLKYNSEKNGFVLINSVLWIYWFSEKCTLQRKIPHNSVFLCVPFFFVFFFVCFIINQR